jgi:hypothetical protein
MYLQFMLLQQNSCQPPSNFAPPILAAQLGAVVAANSSGAGLAMGFPKGCQPARVMAF